MVGIWIWDVLMFNVHVWCYPSNSTLRQNRPWQINLLVLSETFDCDPELSDSELAIKTCSAFNEDLQLVCLTEPIYKWPPRICADLNKWARTQPAPMSWVHQEQQSFRKLGHQSWMSSSWPKKNWKVAFSLISNIFWNLSSFPSAFLLWPSMTS